MNKKTMVSIDWDFFVPENIMHDFGHRENLFFINTMWQIRLINGLIADKDYEKIIQTNDFENEFWNWLKQKNFTWGKKTKLFVTESHAVAYKYGTQYEVNNIFNFDSHSDLGYTEKIDYLFDRNINIDCGNWLAFLSMDLQYRNSKTTLIYSTHSNETIERFDTVIKALDIKIFDQHNFQKQEEKTYIDVLHICRSGAWTPPWLDNKFYNFVKRAGIKYKVLDIVERNYNKEEAEKQAEEQKAVLNSKEFKKLSDKALENTNKQTKNPLEQY